MLRVVPPVRLRRCTSADRAFVLAVRRAAFGTAGDAAEDARADRALDDLPFSIVEVGGEAHGYVAVVPAADHDFVHELAVSPEWQSRGLGTAVIRYVQNAARRRGVTVRLSVHRDNRALDLYERLGFAVTDVVGHRVKLEWRPDSPGRS
jgi:ribosomal protein S18 acetylase RimI-like enzyme